MDIHTFSIICLISLVIGIFVGLMLAARKQNTTVNSILSEPNFSDQAYFEGYENFVSICGNYMDTLNLLMTFATKSCEDEEYTSIICNGIDMRVSVSRLQNVINNMTGDINKARHKAITKYGNHISSYDLGVRNAIKALKNIEQNPTLFRSVIGN